MSKGRAEEPLYHIVYLMLGKVQSISTHDIKLAEQLYELNSKCPMYECVSLEECKGSACNLSKCPRRLAQPGRIQGIYVPMDEKIILDKKKE